jgi:hypothetical protein
MSDPKTDLAKAISEALAASPEIQRLWQASQQPTPKNPPIVRRPKRHFKTSRRARILARWRLARRKARLAGLAEPPCPFQRYAPELYAAAVRRRKKSGSKGGRKPIENPLPRSLEKRAYRARKKAEAAAAEAAARKAKRAQSWQDFKRRHPDWKPKRYRKATVAEKKLAPYLNEWYAPDLSYDDAVKFVQSEVVPQQPQAAGSIVDAVQRDCHRYNLCRNRFTLRRGGIQEARILRNLILQAWDNSDANPDVSLEVAIRIAATQNQADLPAEPNAAKRLNDNAQQDLAQGAALLRLALGSTAE